MGAEGVVEITGDLAFSAVYDDEGCFIQKGLLLHCYVDWPDFKSITVLYPNRKVKCIHDHTKLLTMNALDLLRQAEPTLKKRYGVAKIGIFGSFVRGEERLESDIDVLVTFRKGQKTFENYMECKFYLEDLFQRKVDLVLKNTIKSRLRPYILGEVVYA